MIKRVLFAYTPHYATVIVYMLQGTEYNFKSYLSWLWRTRDYSKVMYRRQLDRTRVARLLSLFMIAGMASQLAMGIVLVCLWKWNHLSYGALIGGGLIISYPIVWSHLIIIPVYIARELYVRPTEQKLIAASERIFSTHPGVKIAVAGSYGKTSMKELLLTVLSTGLKVAATPANKNVAVSHAHFANSLVGDEDVIVVEYGEGQPGDIVRFAKSTKPQHGIITGLAPAHLDKYKSLKAAAQDIMSLTEFLDSSHIYVNAESPELRPYIRRFSRNQTYSVNGVLDWKVNAVVVSIKGTDFILQKASKKIELHSDLIGRHNIGPLALVAVLALKFGLSVDQVKQGVLNTKPYEHRMQPYQLSGAWIIDDTYNGNLEGVRAGTRLLAELPSKRKIYVTPGLVEQGDQVQSVHFEVGQLIAKTKPDVVVLIQNSVTKYIVEGLVASKYEGRILQETDPLKFYSNLDQFVAAGDVVLMQNDWTDNYV